ncbi:MAG: hypothetical protein EOM18_15380 [Clostridia bacterium]|nr:hypothetical protein [Clostridia bacterium]
MPKQTIYSILINKDVTEEKLQEIIKEHNFSIEEKTEGALEGYDVYKQIEDDEVDLETRKMAALGEDSYVIVADLKEDSEKEALEKEMDYETMEKVADSMFSMVDLVLGTMRQPEAEGESRKEMIMSAVGNFTKYVEAALSTMKAEDVLAEYEINSEEIQKHIEAKLEKEEDDFEFDPEKFGEDLKEELISKFTEMLETKVKLVKEEVTQTEKEMKDGLNESLNEQFELYTKKEDLEKELETVKAAIEEIKNTAKSRNSEIDENVNKKKKSETKTKKNNQFVTFV